MECDGLQVDTQVLHAAGAALRAVRDEVRHAEQVADVGAAVLAHAGVRERVLHLATGWAGGRAALATDIEWLGRCAEQAAAEFERIERSLVAALGEAA